MDSVPSAASSVLPDVSQIQLSRRRSAAAVGISATAGGRPVSAHQVYGPRAVVSSPVDAVLRHFRAVRQREQELHQQRQAALQRFSLCSPHVRVQTRSSQHQSQHILDDLLHRQRPVSAKLARDSRPASACPTNQQAAKSQLYTQGQSEKVSLQHWDLPASSLACNSFRHSLPPHSQRPSTPNASAQRPGTACLSVAVAQRCNQSAHGRQSSFSKRAAYNDVLRRVRTPQT